MKRHWARRIRGSRRWRRRGCWCGRTGRWARCRAFPVTLEVVTGADAVADLRAAKAAVPGAARVIALPRGYLKSHQPEGPWPEGAGPMDLIPLVREVFPGAEVGGGMLTNFTEFNRCPPDAGQGRFLHVRHDGDRPCGGRHVGGGDAGGDPGRDRERTGAGRGPALAAGADGGGDAVEPVWRGGGGEPREAAGADGDGRSAPEDRGSRRPSPSAWRRPARGAGSRPSRLR